ALLGHAAADMGVRQRVEGPAGLRVCKDACAERGPIDRPIGPEDAGPECPDDSLVGGQAGGPHLARDRVGFPDRGGAARDETAPPRGPGGTPRTRARGPKNTPPPGVCPLQTPPVSPSRRGRLMPRRSDPASWDTWPR